MDYFSFLVSGLYLKLYSILWKYNHPVKNIFLSPSAQVDSRILKAVAIENSKDVDAAAEIVLSEILPYLSKQIMAASSSSQTQSPQVQPNEGSFFHDLPFELVYSALCLRYFIFADLPKSTSVWKV